MFLQTRDGHEIQISELSEYPDLNQIFIWIYGFTFYMTYNYF